MIIILDNNFKLMLITLAINGLAQMQHTNDEISIVTCKGNDVDMLWNVDEEESKIILLQLYFSGTIICFTSLVNDSIVSTSYQGRIERMGKTDFQLKNVSLDDEGNYTMFALEEWSTNLKMKKMVLRILEPPTKKCTCNIQPDFKCQLPTSDCGRPTVSVVWKRKQTYENLGVGNWTMNSTLQDEEILSCLDGEAMKCVNDSRQFCTSVSIPHQVTVRSHEDRNTQRTDSVTVPGFRGTDNDSTAFNKYDLLYAILAFTALTFVVGVLIASAILCYRGRLFTGRSDPSHDTREAVPMKDSNAENDFQKLQNATHEMIILLNEIQNVAPIADKRNATGKSVPKNQCMSDSDTEGELQKLLETDFFPSIDPEGPISMNDLNIERDFQNLQKAVFHMRSFLSQVPEEFITWLSSKSAEFIPMNQPMNDLNSEGDLQNPLQPTLDPIKDTGEAICMKDSHVENEFQRLQKATRQMMHLFIKIYKEYTTYKMLGKAEIVTEHQQSIFCGT